MDYPVLIGRPDDAVLTRRLLEPVWTKRSAYFRLAFVFLGLGSFTLFGLIAYTLVVGIGVWGNNIPVAWAFDIINFVWWIGIGHAGTLISAFLLLLEQRWRASINRFAEAMTVFAVMQAGIFPLLHLGRPWFAYWLVPYPSTMKVWPNFKSALPWDVAAVSTYFTVSLLFWYVGLIPDFASLRDSAPGRLRRMIYGVLALGWRGSADGQRHYRVAYGVLAGLSTPLVISVHSVVSTDFAISLVPGWHSTIFPPYFVAGAIFSGFAMVLTLVIPVRHFFHLEDLITRKHLDNIAKLILTTGWIVFYAYALEGFLSWYSGERYDFYLTFVARPTGPGRTIFWLAIFCNCLLPQIFWFGRMRVNTKVLWIVSLFINLGMWSERFIIIVQSLEREFLPAAWSSYCPTYVDLGILTGTICFFLFLFLAFLRWVPLIPVAEVKELKADLVREEQPA